MKEPGPPIDLAPDLLEDLAWHSILADDVYFGGLGITSVLDSLLARAGLLRGDRAVDRLRSWLEEGGALATVRATHEGPARLLTEEEAGRFVDGCQGLEPLGCDDAWRVLVRAGFEAREAERVVRAWTPADGLLPDGQFMDPDVLARTPEHRRVRLPEGKIVDRRSLQNALIGARSMPGHADLRLRQGVRCEGIDVPNLVRAAAHGRLVLVGVEREPATVQGRSTARQRLDAARDSLLIDRPLHWTLLSFALVREDPSHPSLAVGLTVMGEVVLFYNSYFISQIDDAELRAVLEHEVNHVLFDHLRPRIGKSRAAKTAWRLACECTANEFVRGPLPGLPITIDRLGLPPHESTMQRYDRLMSEGPHPEERSFCLGAIGVALVEDPAHHADIAGDVTGEKVDLVRGLVEGGAPIDPETAQALNDHNSGRDSFWRQVVAQALDPDRLACVPWRAVLRSMASTLRDRAATLRWPSRREPDRLGVVPGRRRARSEPVILVAIDTSGSMTRSLLSDVGAEITALAATGVRFAVVHCDTEIRAASWWSTGPLTRALGRGGTDLRPPFAPDVLRRFKPDGVVYFTDGDGPAPDAPPAGVDVVWVLMGRAVRPATWGRVVAIDHRCV